MLSHGLLNDAGRTDRCFDDDSITQEISQEKTPEEDDAKQIPARNHLDRCKPLREGGGDEHDTTTSSCVSQAPGPGQVQPQSRRDHK